jgi:glucose/arabinose dehydrogenase
LLGLAFTPDGAHLDVDYTDLRGDTRVVEYAMRGARADPRSARQILFVDQPFANHNGGNLVFGPDGFLYVGLGDGGSAGDPNGNGQALDTRLGKILRIDPRRDGRSAYTVPTSNPFAGDAAARPEIWAYGLRNPWRFSFDRATGDLWIGDVGQASREEVDVQPASSGGGENYGWNAFEGTLPYGGQTVTGTVTPVYEYGHSDGRCAITGGYVYRGSAIPGLDGAYVFGPTVPALASFGEDRQAELYALSLTGDIYRLVP